MTRPWKQFEDELAFRGKTLTWLAEQLDCSIQRVQNWTTRGVPRGAFPEVAKAFGESIDWVAGLEPPKRTQKHVEGHVLPMLDDDSLAFAVQYQKLSFDQRSLLRDLYFVAVRQGKPQKIDPTDFGGGIHTNYGDETLDPTGDTS